MGRDLPYDELKKDDIAVFVGSGAHVGRKMRVEGEDAEGVYRGAEFLNAAYAGAAPDVGKDAIIIGGGNTAIDAARVCKRLGAENVTIDDWINGREPVAKNGLPLATLATKDFTPYIFKLDLCQGCNKCMEECPCGFVEMQ